MTSNEQIRDWKKKNTRQYLFYVNRNKDEDVIAWLDSIPLKQQYLVNLVKEDMRAKNSETSEGKRP